MEEGKLTRGAGAGQPEQAGVQNGQLALEFPPTENEKEQEAVVEAVLFTMGRSVEVRQLAAAIGQDRETARRAVERLKARYDKSRSCGMQIIALEDSYQMCTKAKYYDNLIRVASTPKKQVLTEVMLETLSIIAYKQPVTKLEIEKIRGVKSDHAVNRLIEFNLVYEVGRMDAPGRPALFATTEEFLRRFGVGSTDDLPSMNPEQAEEIKAEVEEELQLKLEDLAVNGDGGEAAADAQEETEADLAVAEAAAGVEISSPGGETAVRAKTVAQDTSPEDPTPEGSNLKDPTPKDPTPKDPDLTEDELALLEQEAAYAAELEAAAAAREEEEERERR
ncbi:SMC-Scp complex subunit ScpB [Enterocloster asparagiformis]|uniref:Segregation and condensation protein B n=2 Tax=Enterocloster asparagiformis TaxID=333367 RepID=A0A413F7R4_9FIRM|nr:SMC-Scp complex subunit ScpB [Enterocloster asparagiformis]RGX22102.1 SMC-Scp complex subunit ScpB [Enterocloster asparagiformis]